jgi:hypothetical protein
MMSFPKLECPHLCLLKLKSLDRLLINFVCFPHTKHHGTAIVLSAQLQLK